MARHPYIIVFFVLCVMIPVHFCVFCLDVCDDTSTSCVSCLVVCDDTSTSCVLCLVVCDDTSTSCVLCLVVCELAFSWAARHGSGTVRVPFLHPCVCCFANSNSGVVFLFPCTREYLYDDPPFCMHVRTFDAIPFCRGARCGISARASACRPSRGTSRTSTRSCSSQTARCGVRPRSLCSTAYACALRSAFLG